MDKEGRERTDKRDGIASDSKIGEEEESTLVETKVLILLPRKKIFS